MAESVVKKFTYREMRIAVEVLSQSQLVQNWCKGEAEAYGMQCGTPEYDEFVKVKSRKYAKKLLR